MRDLQTNTTTFVSRAPGGSGAGGDSPSFAPSISADGRYVAFESAANNLSGADDNGVNNVFVRDLQNGVTTYVNQAIGGAAADGKSSEPTISADGHYVAFSSQANNLTADDNDTYQNIYVRDLQASTTTYVSRAGGATGAAADNVSEGPSISGDARLVAFSSEADNLSTEDDDGYTNIFVRDVQEGITALAEPASSGPPDPSGTDDNSFNPSISADGRYPVLDQTADSLSTERRERRGQRLRA